MNIGLLLHSPLRAQPSHKGRIAAAGGDEEEEGRGAQRQARETQHRKVAQGRRVCAPAELGKGRALGSKFSACE